MPLPVATMLVLLPSQSALNKRDDKNTDKEIILGICFIIYTIAGGMNAVGSTNILHLVCMYGGAIIALVYLSKTFGGLDWLGDQLEKVNQANGENINYFSLMQIGMPKVSSWMIAGVLGALTAQAGI